MFIVTISYVIIKAMGWGLELVAIAILLVGTVYEVVRRVRSGESIAAFQLGPLLSSEAEGHSWAPIVPGPLMSPTEKWGPRPDRPSNDDATKCETGGMTNASFESEADVMDK